MSIQNDLMKGNRLNFNSCMIPAKQIDIMQTCKAYNYFNSEEEVILPSN
jgi:hypothetical protein